MPNIIFKNALPRIAAIGCLLFLSSASLVSAQDTFTWNAVFADYQIDSVQGIRLETHYRTKDFWGGQQQFILRPSYVRKLNNQITLSGGYSFLNTEIASGLFGRAQSVAAGFLYHSLQEKHFFWLDKGRAKVDGKYGI